MNLSSITIPEGIKSIGNGAFAGCTSLETVNYNATNCTSAGSSSSPVFANCYDLHTINIGENVKTLPAYLFFNNTGISHIVSNNPEPPTCTNANVFTNVDKTNCILTVPDGARDNYANAAVWKDFYNIVELNASYIDTVVVGSQTDVNGCYTIGGVRIDSPKKGINIVKYSDGSVRKVYVK